MKAITTTAAPAFTLEPTLPWLRTDPTMQRHEAFVGMRTVMVNKAGWAPMGLYFPGGVTLAAVQINKIEDLTPGIYWTELEPSTPAMYGMKAGQLIYDFGRFEGFGELSRAEARSYKQGRAHIELGSDNLDCDMQAHRLRQDGTTTIHVNFGPPNGADLRRVWRITHYVDMPFSAMESLGAGAHNAYDSSGMTEAQARWLKEETALRTEERCSEYSAYTLGEFPEASCRAILRGEENTCFGHLFSDLPTLSLSQAKKRKSGAVAIAWRSYAHEGKPIGYTLYYKVEVARVMLETLQSHAEVERARVRHEASASALLQASADLEVAREASVLEELNKLRLQKKASQPVAHEPVRELAHAA